MTLTRDELLTLGAEPERVESKFWGTVYVRVAKAREFDQLMVLLEEYEGYERLAALAIMGACDAKGKPLFEDGDIGRLMEGPLEPLATVATAFLTLNGIEPDEEKKSSRPGSNSPTPWPTNSASRSRSA